MVTLDRESPLPVYIVRGLEVVLTLITFSLVASVGHSTHPYWVWCMFSWCFCFIFSLLILILEISNVNLKLPISWGDFTCAFSMLSSLMILAASVLYSVYFTCPDSFCSRQIGASVCSWLAFILYCVEVGLIRAKPGEISGFLSTVPGLLKVIEAYVACIIFICLDSNIYNSYAGLQWCVAVYCICFIFSLVIILFTIGRLLALFPAPLNKVLTVVNVLAVLMYFTAVIIWPVFSFKFPFIPTIIYNRLVVISFMSCVNLIAYIVDTVYSVKLVFFVSNT